MSAIDIASYDASYHDPSFGTDSKIQCKDASNIEIKHRITMFQNCLYFCEAGSAPRKYAYIFENGYQTNTPISLFCIPPNFCCPGTDMIYTSYFDRGIWDTQNLCRTIGCYKGDPKLADHVTKYVCCCLDCIDCYNYYASACYCPMLCGETIAVVPFDTFCFCIPNQANWCTNCCSLCGPKDGEPCYKTPYFLNCLAIGEADKAKRAMNSARAEWAQKNGISI